jgi:ketosteroid isomerase-like protein
MSRLSLETVQRLYEAMNARDLACAIELADPDVEWVPDSRVAEGAIRGRANVGRFFMDRAEMFERLHVEVERCWEKDDRVLVFLRVAGRGQASGAEFEIRIGHLWTVRDGLLVRGEGYGDRREALKAAGIDE